MVHRELLSHPRVDQFLSQCWWRSNGLDIPGEDYASPFVSARVGTLKHHQQKYEMWARPLRTSQFLSYRPRGA